MRNLRIAASAIIIAAVVMLIGAAAGAEVSLQGKPAVRAEGGGVRIEFALTAPGDVEVAIVNEKGEVVRHLAAGVVGMEKAAPPLAAAACAQSLLWDRRDDDGKAVAGKAAVRIRAGMRPALGKLLGDPARLTGRVYGLATDEKGRLYVASGGVYDNAPVFSIKVFDRDGKYLRTILPMPASLAVENAAEYGEARSVDGHLVPGNFHPLSPYVQEGGIVAFVGNQVRDGLLWLLSTEGTICRIRTDGTPVAWKSAPKTVQPFGGPMCWAVAPDGAALYLAGWWNRDGAGDGVVWKVDPATGKAQDFLSVEPTGNQAWVKEPNGWYHFKNWGRKNGLAALHGLAVDSQNRLYVCDRVGGSLVVYDVGGRRVGATPLEFPDCVALSPSDQTVYVCARKVIDGYKAVNEFRVVKLSGGVGGRALAELTLKGSNAPAMAVDATARPAVIWLSNVVDPKDPEGKQGTLLVRIEDRGRELVVTGQLNENLPPAMAVVKVFADPLSDDVYVNDGWSGLSRYDGLTGDGGPIPITAIDLAVGADRNLYLYGRKGWNEPLYRCGLDLRPVPFSGTGKPETTLTTLNRTVYGRYGTGWSNKGLAVAADGKIYVRHMYEWCKYHVTMFGPDGRAVKGDRVADGVLGPLDDQSGGLKVDRAGNFYVGCNDIVKGGPKLRPLEGCVVKVGPQGGGLVPKKGDRQGLQLEKAFFEGAVTVYPHLAPRTSGGCVCKEARFDLDEYGRLYVPNVHDFCIRIYDNASNLICTVGHYGNADSAGRGSQVPSPEVPLGWPMTCGVNRAGRLYVGDVLNQRIARLDLGYAAEVSAAVE
jgi:hypothetical protein